VGLVGVIFAQGAFVIAVRQPSARASHRLGDFSTGTKTRKERAYFAHVLQVSSACVSSWKNVMRPLNFLLTASVFSTLVIGLALASAVATKALHEQIAVRPSVAASAGR
jgi:hypothetical protein